MTEERVEEQQTLYTQDKDAGRDSDTKVDAQQVETDEAQDQKDYQELFKRLVNIVKDLGWGIAIPQVTDNEAVPGVIIGTKEYLNLMMQLLPSGILSDNNKCQMYL